MKSTTTTNFSEVVDRVHIIHTLWLHHYMMWASIETVRSSMRARTVLLNTGFKYDIIRHSASPIGRQCHVFLNYIFPPMGVAKQNLLLILSAIILWLRCESAVKKTIPFWMII